MKNKDNQQWLSCAEITLESSCLAASGNSHGLPEVWANQKSQSAGIDGISAESAIGALRENRVAPESPAPGASLFDKSNLFRRIFIRLGLGERRNRGFDERSQIVPVIYIADVEIVLGAVVRWPKDNFFQSTKNWILWQLNTLSKEISTDDGNRNHRPEDCRHGYLA